MRYKIFANNINNINPNQSSITMKQEILKYSYWEHFNYAKQLALVLPIDHPKRIKIEEELNKIQSQITK